MTGNPEVLTLLREFHPLQFWLPPLWCSLAASFTGCFPFKGTSMYSHCGCNALL